MEALLVVACIWVAALAAYVILERRDPSRSDLLRLKRAQLPSARDRHAVDGTLMRAVRVPHPQI